MNETDEDLLITAWHSTVPMYEIARRFSLKEEEVRLAWRRLQIDGKLPVGRRSFVKPGHKKLKPEPKPQPMRMDPNLGGGVEDQFDGRPSLMFHDPLLDRLREVHGEPRYDIPKLLLEEKKEKTWR